MTPVSFKAVLAFLKLQKLHYATLVFNRSKSQSPSRVNVSLTELALDNELVRFKDDKGLFCFIEVSFLEAIESQGEIDLR